MLRVVVIIVIAITILKSLPDIARYLRIRGM